MKIKKDIMYFLTGSREMMPTFLSHLTCGIFWNSVDMDLTRERCQNGRDERKKKIMNREINHN